MSKTLDEIKQEAKEASTKKGGGKVKTPETIESTFREGSGSQIIYKVLKSAKKSLKMTEIIERSVNNGLKNPGRPKVVVRWFVQNKIVTKNDDGTFDLIKPKVKEDAKAPATAKAA